MGGGGEGGTWGGGVKRKFGDSKEGRRNGLFLPHSHFFLAAPKLTPPPPPPRIIIIIRSSLSAPPTRPSPSPPTHITYMGRRASDPIVPPVIKLSEDEYVDLNTHMLRNRIIFIGERINDQVATKVVASLLALDAISSTDEVKIYINSAAGSPYSVISILDTLRMIKAPVSTVAFGFVAGACVNLLAAGDKGRRYSMRNTRIMLQQPNGGAQGSADEVNIGVTELNRTMRVLYRFLSESSGLAVEQIEEECDREQFCSATRAMELGLIDGVIGVE